MEIAERIGKTAFSFNLVVSIIVTVIGVALMANGINPGEVVSGLFMPIDWIYRSTAKVQSSLPSEYSPIDVVASLGAAGIIAIFLEFLFMMLAGFLILVYTIATIIPSQLKFLVVPLFFLGAFVQLMVWIYAVNMLFEKLASLIPFARR